MIESLLDILKHSLGIFWTPGLAAFVVGVGVASTRLTPIVKEIWAFLQGQKTKKEERLSREAKERREELEALQAVSREAMGRLIAENQRLQEDVTQAEAEKIAAHVREERQRRETDFERSYGLWHYSLAIAWYQRCHRLVGDWRAGNAAPTDDLPSFEAVTASPPPQRPAL